MRRGRRRRGAGGDGRARDRRHRAAADRSRRRWRPATCSSRRPAGRSATRAARKRATDAGARGATMPGVTEDMLARVMAVDFDTMAARSKAVAALLDQGTSAHVTCPRGTDLELALDGRAGISDDGELTAPGRVREPALRRGVHRARVRGGDRRARRASRRSGSAMEPATLTVAEGRIVAADRWPRPAVHRAAARARRARHQPRRARRRDERPGAADRQRARGREDPRHGARRVRRQRRDRRHGIGPDPPRRRRPRREPRGGRAPRCSTPAATCSD